MQVTSVKTNSNFINFNSFQTTKMKSQNSVQNTSNKVLSSSNTISSSVYKANYLPSFGRFKKVDNVALLNKDTGRVKIASLQKEVIGDFISYRIMVDRDEAGYMHMLTDTVFPENDCVLTEPDNNIPEVRHLRSIKGNQYAGIGTALIDAAVQESKALGKRGALWLNAQKGYAFGESTYRSNENPIPFYYKLGFRSLNENIDNLIKRAIKESKYGILPSSTILFLPSDKADDVGRYYANHYTHNYD